MEKLIKLIIGILFGNLILIASIISISAVQQDLTFQLTKISQQKLTLELQKDYYPSILDFEKIESIAQDVANSHEYELHIFDCTDFSKELKNRLNKLGYKARCDGGYNYQFDYPAHSWIVVEINNEEFIIESTSGEFISKEDYKNYEVKYRGICW